MTIAYKNRTVNDLKTLAKDKGVKGYSVCKNKAELISLLQEKGHCAKRCYSLSPGECSKRKSYTQRVSSTKMS